MKTTFLHISFFKNIFYCTLGFGVHVQNLQDFCIGTYMAMYLLPPPRRHVYLTFIPMLSLLNLPTDRYPSPIPPQQTPVCDSPLPVSMCSHFSSPAYE